MNITPSLIEKTLNALQTHMQARGLSKNTRNKYLVMVRRFLRWQMENWHKVEPKKHDARMEDFLSALASNKKRPISLGTQKSYFMALLYFYREFQGKPIKKVNAVRAPHRQRIFNLLTIAQIKILFDALPDDCRENHRLLAKLMFGTGMRLDEVIKLRIKDIRFEEGLIAVQAGKGDKAGLVDLPRSLVEELRAQITYARTQYDMDRTRERAGVFLPDGLATKYPALPTAWEWYWVFPHVHETRDENGVKRRHHINDYIVQTAFRNVRRNAGLPEYATAHMLRHCYATFYLKHLLKKIHESGLEIPDLYGYCRDALRKKLRHVAAPTTDMYIHLAMERNEISDVSPLDLMEAGLHALPAKPSTVRRAGKPQAIVSA